MLDTIGYALLGVLMGIVIAFVIYVAVWIPKQKMKGHAGRGKCKCCNN
jgi:ABC-type phosphate/phosphonate transport system permease subunit